MGREEEAHSPSYGVDVHGNCLSLLPNYFSKTVLYFHQLA
jgi:hypothetical protein